MSGLTSRARKRIILHALRIHASLCPAMQFTVCGGSGSVYQDSYRYLSDEKHVSRVWFASKKL
ncbi:predicted protein [Plenodomus lingam JN3]|uniref:Predicted protein n=1 Tax=Leptosphaeria maculans (strain JN3 / isolate v23.1.3 / race Av1-4-5-6-7-8) TaxID=985895 RepID=E4ZUH3_LEPMJ|nr:predicted protein [Plenodomus lingam JN3]CBX95052.1 predicted protein [Plenodomus lingam JN3]